MNADGSPTLLAPPAPMTDLQLAKTDSTDSRFQSVSDAWGIYLNGVHVLEADTVLGLEYRHESRVADFPMEKGAFGSYDKVDMPFGVRVRLAKGGTESSRSDFLAEVEAARSSLNLYDVASPEYAFLGVNLTTVNYSRTATNGSGMLIVELTFEEIRQTAASQFAAATVKSPGAADPTPGGTVQPAAPPPAQVVPIAKAVQQAAQPPSRAAGH